MKNSVIPNSERWLSLEDLPNEEWRDIKDFEGLYKVSNYGRVKSLGHWREFTSSNQTTTFDCQYYVKERILKVKCDRYLRVQLYKSSKEYKYYSVHTLVGEAFIPNPENKPILDHKNNNTYDNTVDNLQWATYKENADYSWERGRKKQYGEEHHSSKLIGQYDLEGNLLNTYYGSGEASKSTGIHSATIRAACRGGYGYKTRGGFIWKYI